MIFIVVKFTVRPEFAEAWLPAVASFTRATLRGVDPRSADLARGRGLTVEPVTLQDLVVDLTMQKEAAR